ncbi:MAG TPA: hypothetical protein VN970_09895, partial [Thermoanaerobaculia bacterium]|nr:hypothetical protein [Thermoanaerobaculia bacterium]
MRAHARLLLVLAALLLTCSWFRPQAAAAARRAGAPVCSPAAQDAFDAGQLEHAREGFAEDL